MAEELLIEAQVVESKAIAEADILDTDVDATTLDAWSALGIYSVSDQVYDLVDGLKIGFTRTAGGGTNPRPSEDVGTNDEGQGTVWRYDGPTQRSAPFDNVIGTSTSQADQIYFKLAPGLVDTIWLLDMAGSNVNVRMTNAAVEIYNRDIPLSAAVILSWGDYFYAPFLRRKNVVLSDIPQGYPGAEVEVTLTGSGTVSIGVIGMGQRNYIGLTLEGLEVSINDYTKKPAPGAIQRLVPGKFSKRVSLTTWPRDVDAALIYDLLEGLLSKPALWIAAPGVEELTHGTAFGYFKDMKMRRVGWNDTQLDLSIEGFQAT